MIEGFDGAVVVRVGLSGPDDLDRALFVGEERGKTFQIVCDEIGPFVARETSCPNNREDFGIEDLSCLVGDGSEEVCFEFLFAKRDRFFVGFQSGRFELAVGPIFLVLRVCDVRDLTNIRVDSPHFAGNLAMKLGDTIRNSGEAKGREGMGEGVIVDTGELLDLVAVGAGEETEADEFVEIVSFVTGGFWGVGGEDELLLEAFFIISF